MTPDLLDGHLLGIGPQALHALRHTLERDFGEQAAAALQEAGYASSEQCYETFRQWLERQADLTDPAQLAASALPEALTDFFRTLGWGRISIEQIGPAGLALDSDDWAEAEPGAGAAVPSCHVTAGLLAGFLGRIAGADVAVMEIECRSCNDPRCRFLAGSAETLQGVFEAMNGGRDYRDVLAG